MVYQNTHTHWLLYSLRVCVHTGFIYYFLFFPPCQSQQKLARIFTSHWAHFALTFLQIETPPLLVNFPPTPSLTPLSPLNRALFFLDRTLNRGVTRRRQQRRRRHVVACSRSKLWNSHEPYETRPAAVHSCRRLARAVRPKRGRGTESARKRANERGERMRMWWETERARGKCRFYACFVCYCCCCCTIKKKRREIGAAGLWRSSESSVLVFYSVPSFIGSRWYTATQHRHSCNWKIKLTIVRYLTHRWRTWRSCFMLWRAWLGSKLKVG